MKTKQILLISFAFLSVLFTGCEKDDPTEGIKADFEVTVGGEFNIEMDSNPTTGYSWKWVNESSVSIVDTVGWSYVSHSSGSIDGGGGKETWEFTGVSKGLDTLAFEYCRSWETNSSADTTYYIIRVK